MLRPILDVILFLFYCIVIDNFFILFIEPLYAQVL